MSELQQRNFITKQRKILSHVLTMARITAVNEIASFDLHDKVVTELINQ